MLSQLGLVLSAAKTAKLFRALDVHRSGKLTLEECKAAVFALDPSSGGPASIPLDSLIGPHEVFALFDRDNSGRINETEFVWTLEFMGYDIQLGDEQFVEQMFHKYDADGSGAIEAGEFRRAWQDLCNVREELRARGVADVPDWIPRWKLVERLDGLLRAAEIKEAQVLTFARRWGAWQSTLKARRAALRAARTAANQSLARALDAAGQVYVLGTGTMGQFESGHACELNPGASRVASLWLDRVAPVTARRRPFADIAALSRQAHDVQLEASRAAAAADRHRAASASVADGRIPRCMKRDSRLDHANSSGAGELKHPAAPTGAGCNVRTDWRRRRSDIRALTPFQPAGSDVVLSRRPSAHASATRAVDGPQQVTIHQHSEVNDGNDDSDDSSDIHPGEAVAGEPPIDLKARHPMAARNNPFVGVAVSPSTLGLWGRGSVRCWTSRYVSVAETDDGRFFQWGAAQTAAGVAEASEMLLTAFGRAPTDDSKPATRRAIANSGWSPSGPGHPFILRQLVRSHSQALHARADARGRHYSRQPSLDHPSPEAARATSRHSQGVDKDRDEDALGDMLRRHDERTTSPRRPPARLGRRRGSAGTTAASELESSKSDSLPQSEGQHSQNRADSASTFSRLRRSARHLLETLVTGGQRGKASSKSIAAKSAAAPTAAGTQTSGVVAKRGAAASTELLPCLPGRFALPPAFDSVSESPLVVRRREQVTNILAMLEQLGMERPVSKRDPLQAFRFLVHTVLPEANCDSIRQRTSWRGIDSTSLTKDRLADLWARIQRVERARLGEHRMALARELEQRISRNRDENRPEEAKAEQERLLRLWKPLKRFLNATTHMEAAAQDAEQQEMERCRESSWQQRTLIEQEAGQDMRMYTSQDTTLLAPVSHPVTPRGYAAEGGETSSLCDDEGTLCLQAPRWTAGSAMSDVALYDKHALALLPSGAVFAAGAGASGRLGMGTAQGTSRAAPAAVSAIAVDDRAMFTRIPGLAGHDVVQISVGASHSAAVTRKGALYTWGSASFGKLGLGHVGCLFEGFASCPVRVGVAMRIPGMLPILSRVKLVSCGASHTACVSVNGHLFVWGDSCTGRLGLPRRHLAGGGLPAETVVAEPALVGKFVDAGMHISSVSCGAAHTLAVTRLRGKGALRVGGEVWVAGAHAACGATDEEFQRVSGPLNKHPVVQVSAGRSHSVALTDDGEVFAWGSNEGRCLGVPSFLDEGSIAGEPAAIRALYTAPTNLARAARATACQSSTYNRAEARRAIDGNCLSTTPHALTHTQREACPWIDIELGQEATVCLVRVWNRSDSPLDPSLPPATYKQRLFPCWLLVLQDDPDRCSGRSSLDAAMNSAVAKKRFVDVTDCIEWTPPPSSQGRFVRLQLEQTNYLHIAEMEVIGQPSGAQRLVPVTHIAAGDRCTVATIGPAHAAIKAAYLDAVGADPDAARVLRQLPLFRNCFETYGFVAKRSETYARLQTLWTAEGSRPEATNPLGHPAGIEQLWSMLMGEEPPNVLDKGEDAASSDAGSNETATPRDDGAETVAYVDGAASTTADTSRGTDAAGVMSDAAPLP